MTLPDPPRILSTFGWRNNAELIDAVHQLGYLRDGESVLDPTFGKGNWWTTYRPEHLTALNRATDGSDFRDLAQFRDGSFDAVAFDPPYVCPGGRKTSTVKGMHDAYGMDEQAGPVEAGGLPDPLFKTPAQLQAIIDAGLTEMARLVRRAPTQTRGGIILVRCMSYCWGGTFWPGAELTWQHAMTLGLVTIDRFDLVKKNGGPQPTENRDGSKRGQQHASRNSSTLWVLRKPPLTKAERRAEQTQLELAEG